MGRKPKHIISLTGELHLQEVGIGPNCDVVDTQERHQGIIVHRGCHPHRSGDEVAECNIDRKLVGQRGLKADDPRAAAGGLGQRSGEGNQEADGD